MALCFAKFYFVCVRKIVFVCEAVGLEVVIRLLYVILLDAVVCVFVYRISVCPELSLCYCCSIVNRTYSDCVPIRYFPPHIPMPDET